MRLRTGIPLVALAVGCVANGDETQGIGPMDVFISEVQPQLATRCASSACHGRLDRPLALLAPGSYRLAPDRRFLNEPLTAEEYEINAHQLMAFANWDEVERSLILTKPLGAEVGGVSHGGGTVFADVDDALYVSLKSWFTLGVQP